MSAAIRVTSKTDNVAGVKLPVFNQYETGVDVNDNLGLSSGGRKITACRERFGEYLKALIKIASLQTSFIAMDEALKITNRRVNALENVTLPKISSTIAYINRYELLVQLCTNLASSLPVEHIWYGSLCLWVLRKYFACLRTQRIG
jgi:V-type H+-transporting ATPase subunit D